MKYLLIFLVGCSSVPGGPATPKSDAYTVELEECNRVSKTFEESVDCENKVRARYGRPPRVIK